MTDYAQKNDGGWCECGECGRRFGGLTGFDAHRADITKNPYGWRCATDAELTAKGYSPDHRGWWRREAQDPRFTVPMRTEMDLGAQSG